MRINLRGRLIWALLLATAFICILSHLFLTNWALNARLNLLLDGYVFCHLKAVDQVKEFPTPEPIEFSTFLVYDGKKYVGYLNTSGNFVSITENSPKEIGLIRPQQLVKIIVLFYLQWICFVFAIVIATSMFWRGWNDRITAKTCPPLRPGNFT
jgi:hypothetical protein